jgi:hypothetical protein
MAPTPPGTPLQHWAPEPLWAGQTVVVIGGGPSLRGFDFSRLRGRHCLAINEAFVDAPWADVLFFRDPEWFARNSAALTRWAGLICTVSPGAKREWPDRLRLVAAGGKAMPRARTSGQQAVSLAIMLAARRVVLIGFDWNYDGGNYHDRHPAPGLMYRGGLLEAWAGYRERAARAGCEILNATPGSFIGDFARIGLSEAFS